MVQFIKVGVVTLVAVSAACGPAFAGKKHHREPNPSAQEQVDKTDVRARPSVSREHAVPPKQIQPWGVMPLSNEVEATLNNNYILK